jgi:hypothetical protein
MEQYEIIGFLERYRQAKRGEMAKMRANPIVKRGIWAIREREYDCCGQKIQYFLNLEHNIHLPVPKIYQILGEKYVIRSECQKNKTRGLVTKAIMPREVIQMDTIDFGELYAFTAVDIFTREADILIAIELMA